MYIVAGLFLTPLFFNTFNLFYMKHLIVVFAIIFCNVSFSQNKTENVIIVTLDGMRWQEVYGGADSALLKNKNYTKDSSGTSSTFWVDDVNERRKKLRNSFSRKRHNN